MKAADEGTDVVIVGGGPAGAVCATVCAQAGLRAVVVERAFFPRDKVCGDCVNPACWPVFARLGLEDAVRALPHADLRTVEFLGLRGLTIRLPLPWSDHGEIAVKRRDLDALLLARAIEAGADVRQGRAVSELRRGDHETGWVLTLADGETINARVLVAADGRNSIIARNLQPAAFVKTAAADDRGRIGLQTHVPCPPDFGARVQMRWFADGYGGLCPVGGGELNISLAAPACAIDALKSWAQAEFALDVEHPWRTIAPLDRAPAARAASAGGGWYLAGDAARVVEPFTGEGIYYALRSGELAAESIAASARGEASSPIAAARYRRAHAAMYRGRLWVNRLARTAGRHPRAASLALECLRWQPGLLRFLTGKVVGEQSSSTNSPRGLQELRVPRT